MAVAYGLLGETLRHSFSPQIHRALGGYDYCLWPTPPEEVAGLFQRRAFRGLNVTIPYKQTVIPLCDVLDPIAEKIGAVNTVVNRGGRLYGYNTDLDGLIALAGWAGVDMRGQKVVILGSGGTSHTARAAAEKLGAQAIVVVSRSGPDNYGNLARHADAGVLINTTPVGMYPHNGAAPLSLDALPHLTGVLDVVYNPLRTALIMDAEARGLPCSGGLPMLVAQARRSVELFTGESVADARMEEVLTALEGQLQNVILIGMPGCGKSTIGRILARELGRTYVDLDEEAEAEVGCPIPIFFQERGEAAFRDLETTLVQTYGAKTGLVIGTGGGVVLRSENTAPLRQNGKIFHLRRDLAALPTVGRPVSQRTPLEELWQQRKARYEALADAEIDNNGTPEETVAKIKKELKCF